MNTTETSSSSETDLDAVFQDLKAGRGRERVNDDNVDALVARARRARDPQLELLLREWRSPCGDDPEAPVLPPAVPR